MMFSSLSLRRKRRKGDSMAKAVLVMDMPECCADCQLADDDPSGLYCPLAEDYYDGTDSSEDRASFCPLRELPERKKLTYTDLCTDCEVSGWNACLDAIAKE